VENEAFDDERDGTARDRVAEVLEVGSVTELRAHADSWGRVVVQNTIMFVV
jgi:hypothetical protein